MKNTAKHTPGAWMQNGNGIFYRLKSGLTEKIATVHGGKFGDPHPNACLIAAAPELLEACHQDEMDRLGERLAWAIAKDVGHDAIRDAAIDLLAAMEKQRSKCHAAIAKAEGRES